MDFEIFVTSGSLQGQRFAMTKAGLRLGRSSSCEIVIPDPALSRNHCLFELRDDMLWVTDLASANGTFINGRQLGADSCKLKIGDIVTVGECDLKIVVPGEMSAIPKMPVSPVTLDLGLGNESAAKEEEVASGRASPLRLMLWVAAVIAVGGAAALILSERPVVPDVVPKELSADEKPVLHALTFEKVEADTEGIYRYALALDESGMLTVEIDDVPKENRHVKKKVRLSSNAFEELCRIVSDRELYALDREYAGVPLRAGSLKSFSLRIVRGTHVFETSIENTQEPDAFRTVRERLETFSKNELGIWAIQFSADKLLEMSAESRRTGDAKWEERDVQYGNLAAAFAAYSEAVFYLETINPKPADYGALVAKRNKISEELEKRYRNQRFLVDRAINLADWMTAQRELRVLCEMIPDAKDPRHAEASAKLIDVEGRIKKGVK